MLHNHAVIALVTPVGFLKELSDTYLTLSYIKRKGPGDCQIKSHYHCIIMKLILTSLMLFAFLVVCRLCKSQPTSTVGDISTIKETSVLLFALKCNKHRYTPIASKPTLLILIHCLLAQCSDIETNPGPNTSQLRYPCGQCNQEVTWRQRGILCDNCNQWFHIDCQNIGDSMYL